MKLPYGTRWSVGLVLSGVIVAQSGESKGTTPVQIEDHIARTQRSFAESESRLQRLQELRLRLAFGLPIDAERYFSISADEREMLRDSGSERLVTEEAELERLSLHANELAERVDARRNAMRPPSAPVGETTLPLNPIGESMTRRIDVPRFGDGRTSYSDVMDLGKRTDGQDARAIGVTADDPMGVPTSSLPFAVTDIEDRISEAETKTPPPTVTPAKPTHIIAGSEQHGAVGRVLLRSGESLLREAAAATDSGHGDALRERARKMFEQAKRELEPLAEGDKAKLIDLYHLARCEEKLGNSAAADSLYAQIISRDETVDENGVQAYGRWGTAAQAAKSVLRWVEDRGGWKPTREIESIRW